jgi:hypothetical protein
MKVIGNLLLRPVEKLSYIQQSSRNYVALFFIGPLNILGNFRVTHMAFNRVVLCIPITTSDLDSFGCYVH